VQLEIMIPLVAWKEELERVKERIDRVAEALKGERGKVPSYMIGTMIELPRRRCGLHRSPRSRNSSPLAPTI